MIVDIKIDLSECYAEDFSADGCPNSSLSEEVISVINYQVENAIQKTIGEKVSLLANKAYQDFGEEKMKTIVDFKMNEFLETGQVRKNTNSSNSEMIPISEKLRNIFDNSNHWSSPYAAMEKMGKQFGEECRKIYDMAFASNIVTGLEKQGLLKDGVFNALMSKKAD